MKLKKPKFWDQKSSNFLSLLLAPFSLALIISNWINKIITKKDFKIKTICVGNIYVGGTGKTPLVIEIFKTLKSLKYKAIFVKKFYKDQYDEIKLLSKSGPLLNYSSRSKSIDEAQRKKFDFAIMDDGLQEKNINYGLKIVCFDKENFIGNGRLIPAGPLREKISSLKNYDIVFFNGLKKLNQNLRSKVKKINKNLKIFETFPKIANQRKISKNKNYLIFSGIGNPKSFEKLLLSQNFKIKRTLVFPDHYHYNDIEISKIKNEAKKLKVSILTTEKDYLRLTKKNKKGIDYISLELKIINKTKFIKILNDYYEKN